ncbi:MAG: ATP-binding cassette domain-containing protein [Luteitalea sp.]|nr:ATP-binding cassette domain-containing protein [Luteitalea sp.]
MKAATTSRPAVPALRTHDLAVGYRSRRQRRAVLERVNLAVDAGELVCLLGPNGIGKSTLMRTLARMQPALWGSVELGGIALESLSASELARRLGVVLTERVAVESLRARQVVDLGRYPHSGWLGGLSDRDHEVVSWAIEAVGAHHLADRDFARISDGERQRVMVARALAQEPLMLLLDEPTAFLDVPSRVELMGLLRHLTRQGPLAVIISTHDLELALRTADVVWLVVPGGELITGAPEDVVLSGGIAQAFEGRQVRFHAEERSFRWLTGGRGTAAVRGEGLPAAMARAVLEREGYTVVVAPSTAETLVLAVGETGWHLSSDEADVSGHNFRSLAAYVRGLPSKARKETES